MNGEKEQLRATLEQLRTQLEHAGSLDAETADRLERTIDEIEAMLSQRPRGLQQADESLTHRLAEAARDFEASHPTLAGTIGSVIDALARMGI